MADGPPLRIVVVSRMLPDPAGSAAARILHASVEGLLAVGHDVQVWSWWPGGAHGPLPSWLRWEPLRAEAGWRVKGRALARPRSDVVAQRWTLPDDVVALAEEPLSYPAVAGHPQRAVTFHYGVVLDQRAVGTVAPRHLQDLRLERRCLRRSPLRFAYSERVAAHLGRGTTAVPAALAIPEQPWDLVDEPVAAMVADWRWPPNRVALADLLAAWPAVRAAVPAARLLLAGYGDAGVGGVAGVTVLGAVGDSAAVLSQAAVLVFPCPPTSGPKVKVLEAAASGLAVLTTPAGIEGLALDGDDVALTGTGPVALAAALVAVLADPGRRAALAASARAKVAAVHAPVPAARARAAALRAALAARPT